MDKVKGIAQVGRWPRGASFSTTALLADGRESKDRIEGEAIGLGDGYWMPAELMPYACDACSRRIPFSVECWPLRC